MKILAIPATNSRTSINKAVLEYAAKTLKARDESITVEFVDLNDYEMPIYSPEREAEGIPALAQKFYDAIGAADAVMVSFAEYNGTYTPAFKNVFDWASRIDSAVYQGKNVAMFGVSPGSRAAANVLGLATMTGPYLGAELVGSMGIGKYGEVFDADACELTDPDLAARMAEILDALIA